MKMIITKVIPNKKMKNSVNKIATQNYLLSHRRRVTFKIGL